MTKDEFIVEDELKETPKRKRKTTNSSTTSTSANQAEAVDEVIVKTPKTTKKKVVKEEVNLFTVDNNETKVEKAVEPEEEAKPVSTSVVSENNEKSIKSSPIEVKNVEPVKEDIVATKTTEPPKKEVKKEEHLPSSVEKFIAKSQHSKAKKQRKLEKKQMKNNQTLMRYNANPDEGLTQEQVEKRIPKIEKKAQSKVDDAPIEYALLKKIQSHLLEEKPIRSLEFDDTEVKYISNYGFLTSKPFMYVANISEEYIANPEGSKYYNELKKYAMDTNSLIIGISAEIESELAVLDDEEKELFLQDYGVKEPGLNRLIHATYDVLGYATYFTTGPDECRAWTFKKGMLAPECAGIIHTDFQRGFIRAETVSYDDLIKCGSMIKAKEAGLVRQEGKDYVVQDGDIMLFKFNV